MIMIIFQSEINENFRKYQKNQKKEKRKAGRLNPALRVSLAVTRLTVYRQPTSFIMKECVLTSAEFFFVLQRKEFFAFKKESALHSSALIRSGQ